MSSTYYPKILIIGQSFNLQSGGGITLTNLFYGWDTKRIAVVTTYDLIVNTSFEVCENYYQLGSLEIRRRFPFNLNPWSDFIKSGIVPVKEVSDSFSLVPKKQRSSVRSIYQTVLVYTGLNHYKRKLRLSEKLMQFIKEFSPDIIYSQLSSLELIRFVNDLKNELKLPVAIHIMDDWPVTICKGFFAKLIWQKTINREFSDLLSEAKYLFSISEAMSQEYLKRYCLKFVHFHNPINISNSRKIKNEIEKNDNMFRILYIGRIGVANKHSIYSFAKAVSNYETDKNKISFDIFTYDIETKDSKKIATLKNVRIAPAVKHEMVSTLLTEYDLLLLPLDFTKTGLKFAQYSIPTKASEYMISGTPILVFAPMETAISKFCYKNECGHCVTEDNQEKLSSSIHFLISNEGYREKLSQNAFRLARELFDADMIRNQFRNSFII